MFVVACLLFVGVLAVSANNDFDMSYNNKGNAGGLENSLTMLQSAAKLQESIAKVPALKTIASLVMERCTNNDDSTVTTCHMFDFLSMCADHLTDSFLHKSSKKHTTPALPSMSEHGESGWPTMARWGSGWRAMAFCVVASGRPRQPRSS